MIVYGLNYALSACQMFCEAPVAIFKETSICMVEGPFVIIRVRQGLKKMGGCPQSGPNAPPPHLAEVSFPGGQPPPVPDPAGGPLPAIFLDGSYANKARQRQFANLSTKEHH